MVEQNDGSTTKLADEAVHSVIDLMRAEVVLLRRSIAKGLNRLLLGIGLLVLAAVVVLVGLSVLADASVAALVETGLSETRASAAVGVGLVILAVGLVIIGVVSLKRVNRAVTLPLRNLQRDATAIKAAFHDH